MNKNQAATDKQIRESLLLFEGLRKKAAPKALVRTLNEIGAKANTETARAVGVATGIQYKLVKRRIKMRRARWSDVNEGTSTVFAILRGYVDPMPVAHLMGKGRVVRRKGGPTRRRKGSTPRGALGGMKVRGKFYLGGFVQEIRRNKSVHLLYRKQKATWIRPGKRAPTEVYKIPLQKEFDQMFEPIAYRRLQHDYAKVVERNLDFYTNQLLGLSNAKNV